MHFYPHLYCSPNIRNTAALKWRLRHNAGNLALWLITPSEGNLVSRPGINQLEIIHCANLHQPYYHKEDILVIGIAEGRWEAIELVNRIMQDCLDQTGGTDLLAFLFPDAQTGAAVAPEDDVPVEIGEESSGDTHQVIH